MNSIRQTQALNKRELENAVPPSASWHADYRDTAYIYVGGLPFDVSEGDIVTIFSQFGNPTHVNLIRDKETGKSKGFAFLKYEDQRSCDLAVDNLGGAEVLGRVLRVDHTRYKKREGEDEEDYRVDGREEEAGWNRNGKRPSEDEETDDHGDGRERKKKKRRPMIKEERELAELLQIKDGEEEDPMREYLIKEKRHEVEQALRKLEKKERKHKHRHRHHHGDEDERTHRRRDGEAESEHRSHQRRDRQDGTEDQPHRRRTSLSSDERPKSRGQRKRDHDDREGERRRYEQGRRD
jgi:RNA-binding motif X-linked protein 2